MKKRIFLKQNELNTLICALLTHREEMKKRKRSPEEAEGASRELAEIRKILKKLSKWEDKLWKWEIL